MDLSFVKDLNESKMFRTKDQALAADARNTVDFAFMNAISLWILYNTYQTAPAAKSYAEKTIMYGNFTTYRQAATDLYIALHLIKNGKAIDDRGQLLYNQIDFDDRMMRYFLTSLKNGNQFDSAPRFFLKLERDFKIENSTYRSIRRLAQDWTTLDETAKRVVLNRLVFYFRSSAIRSELYPYIKELAKDTGADTINQEVEQKTGMSNFSKAALSFAGGYAFGRWLGNKIM